MNKKIYGWWPKSPKPGNMGDIITSLLVKKLFGIDLEWINKNHLPLTREEVLFGTGSIIGETIDTSIVWGSGLISEYSANKANSYAEYLAVRGPITRQLLLDKNIKVPEVYGDPGLLIKEIVDFKKKKSRYAYGIIPHYVDYNRVYSTYKNHKDIKVIDVLNSNPLVPIYEIMECEKTVASSLHGIIFSHAVGISSAWVKFSDKLAGDNTKFFDYFSSVNLHKIKPVEFFETKYMDNHLNKLYYSPPKDIDLNPLLNAFKSRFMEL